MCKYICYINIIVKSFRIWWLFGDFLLSGFTIVYHTNLSNFKSVKIKKKKSEKEGHKKLLVYYKVLDFFFLLDLFFLILSKSIYPKS